MPLLPGWILTMVWMSRHAHRQCERVRSMSRTSSRRFLGCNCLSWVVRDGGFLDPMSTKNEEVQGMTLSSSSFPSSSSLSSFLWANAFELLLEKQMLIERRQQHKCAFWATVFGTQPYWCRSIHFPSLLSQLHKSKNVLSTYQVHRDMLDT